MKFHPNYLFDSIFLSSRADNYISHAVRFMSTYARTFKASDCQVIEKHEDHVDVNRTDLKFGKIFSEHMLEVQWDGQKWKKPLISPFHNLRLSPAAKCLHYAVQLFEGMKAYKGYDSNIRLFRPMHNMERMNNSAMKAALPTFDGEELLDLIKKLVRIDESFVPDGPDKSLYIRPTMISTEASLELDPPKEALLYVLLSPAGPYFNKGFGPVSLLADPAYVRAWPGGVGGYKLGANYGPTLSIQKTAMERKIDQVCWLFGPEKYVTEVGSMNIFIFLRNSKGEKELVTPPLDGLILPGIVRLSVLETVREWNEFRVSERPITMDEILNASEESRLLEIFGCGTAAVICPVGEMVYEKRIIQIPTMEQQNPLSKRLYDFITHIQFGKISHPWAVRL